MLDFGFSEILLTSAIALVVLGPERLPKVARQVGQWVGRARLMARQLSEQLEREVNAAHVEELLKEQSKSIGVGGTGDAPAQPPLHSQPIPPPTPAAASTAAASSPPAAAAPAAHLPGQPTGVDPTHPHQ